MTFRSYLTLKVIVCNFDFLVYIKYIKFEDLTIIYLVRKAIEKRRKIPNKKEKSIEIFSLALGKYSFLFNLKKNFHVRILSQKIKGIF